MTEIRALRVARHLVGLAVVVVGAALVGALVLGRVLPFVDRTTFVITGRSMEPSIHLGSAVIDAPASPDSLAVGQVVTLRVGGQTVFTHRIVRIVVKDGEILVATKGDANPTEDATLTPASAVIGRVELVIPLFGFVIRYLGLPTGLIVALLLEATLYMWLELLEDLETDAREDLEHPERPADGTVPQPTVG